MKIVDCYQNSEEWFKLRRGKMTASSATAIGAGGKGLKTYIRKIMQEYYSTAPRESFSNKHTDRGNELEDSAGFVYFMKTDIPIKKIGFVIHSDNVGCSPDLLAGDNGLVEIKCPDDKGYFNLLLDEKIDSGYIWQMQMQMLICEKDWCDFVAYNPNYKKEVFIKRVEKDQEKFDKLLTGFEIGQKMIEEIETEMNGIL